jgi:hypothetical protein
MFLETPSELLNRSRHIRPIVPFRADLVKHVLDLIKDLLAFICDLPGCLFSLVGMNRVRSLQGLSDLFEH